MSAAASPSPPVRPVRAAAPKNPFHAPRAVADVLWLPFSFGTVAGAVVLVAYVAAVLFASDSGDGTPDWAMRLQDDAPAALFLGLPLAAWAALVGALWLARSASALASRSAFLSDLRDMPVPNRLLYAASWPGRRFARLVWVVARTLGKPLLVLTGAAGLVGAIGGDYRRGGNQYGSWSKGSVTNPLGLIAFVVGGVVTFTFAILVSAVLLLPIMLIDTLATDAHTTATPPLSVLHATLRVGGRAVAPFEQDPTFQGMFLALVTLVWLPAAASRFASDRS